MKTYTSLFPSIIDFISSFLGEAVCLSDPLPCMKNGVRGDCSFIYTMCREDEFVHGRPYGLIVTSMEDGSPLLYRDSLFDDFVDTEKYPFDKLINYDLPIKIDIKEYMSQQSLIGKLYEGVRQVAFTENPCYEHRNLMMKHWALIEGTAPKDLVPFYVAAGMQYLEWVKDYV